MFRRLLYFFCVPCRPNRSRTVRYAFPLVFLTAVSASVASVVVTDTSYLALRTDTTTIRAGEIFTVDLYAVAHAPVNAIDLDVEFPDTQVKVKGIDTGLSVITIWTEEPTVNGNSISFRGGTFRQGFIGEHLIASIEMEAIESGTASIAITSAQFLAGDGSGSEITVDDLGEDSARIYIANEDGSMVAELSVDIITDLDGDGEVTMSDISAFMSAWRSQNVVFDFNGDKAMTFKDFAIILADSFVR